MSFLNPQVLAQLGDRTASGAMSFEQVAELKKALTVGYGTDDSQLTGGAAFRIQSLDRTMKATIQENKHFVLFNELSKQNAGATVDEWTEQSGVGGFLGGSTNTETGNINAAQGNYARRVGLVKYLMTRREVSFVSTLGNNIVQAEAIEAQAGALQLLTDAEYLSFEGDSTVVPTEFDGIFAQIASLGLSDHVIDLAGAPLNSIDFVDRAASTIAGFGNFGTPTHLFLSQKAQSDMNTSLDPAFRVPLTSVPGGGISLGAPVVGIRTSWGDVKNCPDVFVRDETQQMPFELGFAVVAAANAAFKPQTIAATPATGTSGSLWQASQAGAYFYGVTGVNANGQTTTLMSSQVTVAAGGSVSLAIGASASATETGYVIYRGRLNGSNQLTDIREMKRIPVTAGGTTTYVDLNADIPGTTKGYMLNMASGADAINWRQLLPMTKFALYPTQAATIPWAQLLFGYLRIAKRRQHAVFKNIVTNAQVWRPFN